MPDFENIEGAKRIALIEAMIRNKTFVQVSVPESDYDHLTVVTDQGDHLGQTVGVRDVLHHQGFKRMVIHVERIGRQDLTTAVDQDIDPVKCVDRGRQKVGKVSFSRKSPAK